MPITLVTGKPGHGKTCFTVDKLSLIKDRPIFYCGISGLDSSLGWSEISPDDCRNWADLSSGSILIIDEAQHVFPASGVGRRPDWIEALSTHRHLGIDFWLITQHQMLIDSYPRRLVDCMYYLERKFGTCKIALHKFSSANYDIIKDRRKAERSIYTMKRETWDKYKSAEIHTIKRKIPFRFPFIIGTVAASLIGLFFLAVHVIRDIADVDLQSSLNPAVEPVSDVPSFDTRPSEPESRPKKGPILDGYSVVNAGPLAGQELRISATIDSSDGYSAFWVSSRTSEFSSDQLALMGYDVIKLEPCLASLRYKSNQFFISCTWVGGNRYERSGRSRARSSEIIPRDS